ncbi:probable elongator complex protein 2 [Agrilus planipennis]|uniref:Elongator complex protein 2 n=1 Tax=Agrilus planipennis TaxID=224129 RepID=A0A1W4XGC6_AGRPL|nr:probable elongator complex protein 2 [Agrilus planipennis]
MCDVLYVSSACNQVPTSAHWGRGSLICYASSNVVFIYDINHGSGGKIVNTLYGHKKRVNSVQWIAGSNHELELVSGSADGTAIVWTFRDNNYTSFILKGHESNVNVVESMYTKKSSTLVVTTSADSTIRIWLRENKKEDFRQMQVINLNYGVSLSLKLSYLPDQELIILAASLDDSNIHLYVEDEEKSNDFPFKLRHCQKLEGHDNWMEIYLWCLVPKIILYDYGKSHQKQDKRK